MGVDVWMYAERRVDGQWLLAEPLVANGERESADAWLEALTDAERAECADEVAEAARIPAFKPRELYDERCQALWRILGYPFREYHSVTPYEAIAEPRGLPPDVSPDLRAWAAHTVGDHSYPSWLSLRELLRFDWHGKTLVKEAMVDRKAAPLFRRPWGSPPRRGFPWEEWPKGLPIRYGTYLRGGVDVRWIESYAETARSFVTETLPRLQTFGPEVDVRIVFWFDG